MFDFLKRKKKPAPDAYSVMSAMLAHPTFHACPACSEFLLHPDDNYLHITEHKGFTVRDSVEMERRNILFRTMRVCPRISAGQELAEVIQEAERIKNANS